MNSDCSTPHARREGHRPALQDRALDGGDRRLGATSQALGRLDGDGEQLIRLDDPVHHADLQRLLGLDRPPLEDDLERPGAADQAAEALGPAPARGKAQQDLRLAEDAAGADQPQVAGQRQLAAAAHRGAVDRRDPDGAGRPEPAEGGVECV